MYLWICPRSIKPMMVTNRKLENYALWCLSNSIFIFFNPSKTNNRKNRLISTRYIRKNNQDKAAFTQNCHNRITSSQTYNYNNICYFSRKTNTLETGKRNLKNLLHSFCNNHRTLLLKNSAKETSRVLPSELKPSKSNLALPYLPLIKPQTLSFKTKAMPIV